VHCCAETDSLYVEFQERPSVDTREIAADVRLDLDAEGRPVRLPSVFKGACTQAGLVSSRR